jgi:RNA polymerase sigma factor (sigma-70 family)
MASSAKFAPLASAAIRCQPDARLVMLARDGHERAFEEIVRRYRSGLVGFAAAIVSPDRAEDVVQDALTNAYGALASGGAEIQLRPWLYAIVRNRALNVLRDERTHEHLDENYDGVPQPPEVAARREELAALVGQVNALPEAQREALVKRELEGRSHAEIAAALGTTPGAVRALIYRARTSLRDAAGMLIPPSVLRALLNAGAPGEIAGASGAGGTAALLGGGGGGVVVKASGALVIGALALGGGVALHDHGAGRGEATTMAQARGASSHSGHHHAASARAEPIADTASRSDATARGGSSGPSGGDGDRGGGDGSSGPGGGGSGSSEGTSGSDDSGSGEDGGHEGPGGDDGGVTGDDHEGSGGGDDTTSGDGGDDTTSGDGDGDNSGPGGGDLIDDEPTDTHTEAGGGDLDVGDGGGDLLGDGGGGDD